MVKFIVKRLAMMVATLFVILLITFLIMHAIPGGPYSAELLSSYMQILLVEVFRRFPENFVRPARRINPLMYTIQSYIDQNYTQDISVRQLADEHYLSVHYLSHNFKELTGYPVHQYITQKRLLAAAELLRGGASAQAACGRCG